MPGCARDLLSPKGNENAIGSHAIQNSQLGDLEAQSVGGQVKTPTNFVERGTCEQKCIAENSTRRSWCNQKV